MNYTQYSFYIILYILIFSTFSCRKDPSPPATQRTEENSCYYFSDLTNLLSSNSKVSSAHISEKTFFISMENHFLFKDGNKSFSCKVECDDSNLNRIYESLFAKNIMQNMNLRRKFSPIFAKIFRSMKKTMGKSVFQNSIHKWAIHDDTDIVFPSLQRQKLYSLPTVQFPSKELAIKYAIGLQVDNNGMRNPLPNNSLQLDYLLYNAKGSDGIGFQGSHEKFKKERDYFFYSLGRRMRGYRGNRVPENKTLYYGIVKFNLPELKALANSVPWRNWGRDSCVTEASGNSYTKSVAELQIPLACGISGTTNVALWSVFAFGTELNEYEMRLFLLSTWSTLSVDTGHFLQEVLTAAKIVAIYLRGLIEYPDPEYAYFKTHIPIKTLESLEKVVKKIKPLSESNEAVDVADWNTIHDKIYNLSSPGAARKYEALAKDKKSFEQDENEKMARREIEYYFDHYDIVKATGAQFGKYYDSFFRKIHNKSFKKARKLSQYELKSYFNRSCLKQ
ncbi:hypothetical protein [Fluviispira multicolorata]|uniref:Uncharacterized protein n=1 Tax=Fluviispira multicolorata TaxID=2654512 RepID=A0A833N3F7_9BACT|nr:hypothetical protein [Fluviispira multicolorata]KAB8033803.1 hypothetical protein GCL57_03585 [Fluviispira multicolorata]